MTLWIKWYWINDVSLYHHGNHYATSQPETQLLEGLLHSLTLILAHETIVNVNGYHLVLTQGFVQQCSTHGWIHTSAHQQLHDNQITTNIKHILFIKMMSYKIYDKADTGPLDCASQVVTDVHLSQPRWQCTFSRWKPKISYNLWQPLALCQNSHKRKLWRLPKNSDVRWFI